MICWRPQFTYCYNSKTGRYSTIRSGSYKNDGRAPAWGETASFYRHLYVLYSHSALELYLKNQDELSFFFFPRGRCQGRVWKRLLSHLCEAMCGMSPLHLPFMFHVLKIVFFVELAGLYTPQSHIETTLIRQTSSQKTP